MKNAPITNSNESAPNKRDYTAGTLPKRINTVQSSVLACLLESQVITGMESVFKMSTTRLAAFIHALSKHYDWQIERHDVATGTNDGRIAWVTAYWLPQATIAQAFEMGARDWIDEVKTAKAKRSKQSIKCKSNAAKINATRNQLSKNDPRQGNLWGAN